jgi:hypothetical protein
MSTLPQSRRPVVLRRVVRPGQPCCTRWAGVASAVRGRHLILVTQMIPVGQSRRARGPLAALDGDVHHDTLVTSHSMCRIEARQRPIDPKVTFSGSGAHTVTWHLRSKFTTYVDGFGTRVRPNEDSTPDRTASPSRGGMYGRLRCHVWSGHRCAWPDSVAGPRTKPLPNQAVFDQPAAMVLTVAVSLRVPRGLRVRQGAA